MLRFQASTQYALGMLGVMYKNKNGLTRATDMAEKIGTTYLYAIKILGMLKEKGIVCSEQGCNGGYRMAREPEKITVYDVVRAVDGELMLCADHVSPGYERIGKYFESLQGMIMLSLKRESVLSLFDERALSNVTLLQGAST